MTRLTLGALLLASSLVVGCGPLASGAASTTTGQAQPLVVPASAAQRGEIQ
jgi:hypothetical protein